MDDKTSDESIFESKTHDFLMETVSPKAQRSLYEFPVSINCFDVNRNYFVFGSHAGVLYCFRRHCEQEYQKYQFISSAINHVSIISDNLVAFATDYSIYVMNWKRKQFFYCWKSTTNVKITAIQTYLDTNDKKLFVMSGDCSGFVRLHDITTSGQQTVIFCENGFEIIQIEFIDQNSAIVSSTLRTVILRLNTDDNYLVQIGKNERKKPGKYGAVYSAKDKVVYACRPSLHLTKADVITGDVIETIRINNISQSNTSYLFSDNVNDESKSDKINYKLGVLSSFCGDNYLISRNNSQLVIIGSNGEFCLKAKIDDMVCVKTPHRDSNEVFLLLNSKLIIRLTHKSWLCSSENNNNNDDISDDLDLSLDLFRLNSSESLLNLFTPINSKLISFIDDDVKRAFDMFHTNLVKKFDQLSTSIILSINNNDNHVSEINNINTNSFEDTVEATEVVASEEVSEEQDVSPIVVPRKNKKRHQEKTKNVSESTSTDNTDSLSKTSVEDESLPIKISNENKTPSMISAESLTDEASDDRLQAILNAYKEAAANFESNLDNFDDNALIDDNDYSIENFDATNYNNNNHNNETILPVEYPIPVANNCGEETVGDNKPTIIESKWHMVFSAAKKKIDYNLLSICVSCYNSAKEMGLMWYTGKRENEVDTRLLYYPYLNELKLPPKSSASQITASNKDLYVLCTNGYIYKREGINACKPLGNKWLNVKLCKSKAKLKSISLNNSNGIVWCCDENGEAWTLNTKNQSWIMINDFSSHAIEFNKVCVAFNNHSIVWAIDKRGKIFVRLFNSSGDSWLLVDGILATDLAVCERYVWIVVERSKLYRRSNVCDNNYDVNDWQRVHIPFDSSDDSFQSISVSENKELWILTGKCVVWRAVNEDSQRSRDADLGWFLV